MNSCDLTESELGICGFFVCGETDSRYILAGTSIARLLLCNVVEKEHMRYIRRDDILREDNNVFQSCVFFFFDNFYIISTTSHFMCVLLPSLSFSHTVSLAWSLLYV